MGVEYSIITVCRNAADQIGRTIDSVCSQKFDMRKLEMLIIDGASTDNTADVVQRYKTVTENVGLMLRFQSEPDKGIYDAMNKGARLAQGTWCIYLNAGDVFYNEKAMQIFEKASKNDFDILYGDMVMHYRGRYRTYYANRGKLTFLNGMEFCHQSALIRRVFLVKNPYSLTYKVAGDFEFFVRAFIKQARFQYVQGIIALFDNEGLSANNTLLGLKENNDVLLKYGLISKEEYNNNVGNARIKLKILSYIPKKLLRLRFAFCMWRATRHWRRTLQEETF